MSALLDQADAHDKELVKARDRAESQRREESQWRGWGIIEIAVRNQSVSDYMEHWEGRALKAEAEVERLKALAPEHQAERQFWKSIINGGLADHLRESGKTRQDTPEDQP